MHAGLLLSIAQKYGLPNMVMLHNQGAFGEAVRLKGGRVLPTTVIAKRTYAVPGILVPNPFFAHGNLWSEWVRLYEDLEQGRKRYPWNDRDRRAFWRGEILGEHHSEPRSERGGRAASPRGRALALGDDDDDDDVEMDGEEDTVVSAGGTTKHGRRRRRRQTPTMDAAPPLTGGVVSGKQCKRHLGNYERLVAASLTVAHRDVFDVRCNHACQPRREATFACPAMPYDDDMRRAAQNASLITDLAWVEQTEYARYQYLVNLPGKTSGSYSRNLNHLWLMGSVVVLWDMPTVEWYYPALRNGVTHVAVNKTNAFDALTRVRDDAGLEKRLAENAVRVGHEFICAKCLAHFLREALLAYRDRFGQAAILDDPARARALFERHLVCGGPGSGAQPVEFYFVDDAARDKKLVGEHRILDRPVACDALWGGDGGGRARRRTRRR
mmetsp:Transcript_15015/g.60303  ORF Transcript_15015/g.60303 Transcript_15015/m.60303 type:complete len:439 (+) Transcript_15015:663-1979(+)